MQVVALLQNDYNLTVCFPDLDFIHLVKQYLKICMFLCIQATTLPLYWMKNFSLDCNGAILSWRKAIYKHVCCECKSLMVLLCCWMLNPETTEYVNTVFCHIYLAITNIGCAY